MRKKLTGLRPQTYEHPWDAHMLDALQNTMGLDLVVRKCNEWGFERLLQVQLTGSHLRVTADVLPAVYEMVLAARDMLDLPVQPDVYIADGGEINAFTAGVERPIVVLNSGAIDLLSDDELFFVIAHELGHIKSGHVLYYQIAQFLPLIGEVVSSLTFGFSKLISGGLGMALMQWKRTSELTADRAGLLAVQDASVATTAFMKIAGLPQKYYGRSNPEDFITQAREFKALGENKLNLIAKWLGTMNQSHPWTVLRASELLAWVDSGAYAQVLSAPVPSLEVAARRFCVACGEQLGASVKFCTNCGAATRPAGGPPVAPRPSA